MNNIKRYLSRLLYTISIAFLCGIYLCQAQTLSFNDTSIDKVIATVESKTDYVFNYDPTLLEGYTFSGKLDVSTLEKHLKEILYDSPFTFLVDDYSIIVYQEAPKKYRVCGRVVDALSQRALIAASVYATDISQGVESNELGIFDFEIIADKDQVIEISYLGYEIHSFMVQDLLSSDCPDYPLLIDQDLFSSEIIISDYILDGIQQSGAYGAFSFDYDRLSKNHSNVEHDILKTAQLLPGIISIDDSATNIKIRGSNSGQNLILWEGAPVYNAGHIFGMISAINPFSVDQVDIYKGAYDPSYDNRVGGIIDISQTDSIANKFQGSAGTTFTEVHANLDIPIIKDHLSLALSGRQSIRGIYNSPTLESYTDKVFQYSIIDDLTEDAEQGLIDTEQSLDYNDLSAKLLFTPSDQLRFSLGAYSNEQDFEYSFSFSDDPFISEDKIGVATRVIHSEVEYKPTKQWSSILSFYRSSYSNAYNNQQIEQQVIVDGFDQFNSIIDESYSLSNIYKPSGQLNFKAGYEYNVKRVALKLENFINFNPDFTPLDNETARFHNLFLSTNYRQNLLNIDVGIKTTYYEEQARWTHSPRINLQYKTLDNWTLKADAGIYYQFINQINSFGVRQIPVDNPIWIVNSANTELSQRANKLAAGLVYNKNGWLLDVDAFYNLTKGISTLSPSLNLLYDQHSFSLGDIRTKGIDLLIKKQWNPFNVWLNYSLAQSKMTFTEIAEEEFTAPNDIRHTLSLVTSYRVKGFQFSLNANYHSGLPYSRPDLVFNEEDPMAEAPFQYLIDYKSKYNDIRLDPYLRLDFNLNYRFTLPRYSQLQSEISLSVINWLNRNNVLNREYFSDYDEETDVYSLSSIQKLLLDRTPLLMIRFYW